jgi:dienelactone hydrolase
MGFCLGGLMTFLTAAREKIDAAVAYHGGDTEKYLDEADKITAPMLMRLAEEDEFVSRRLKQKSKPHSQTSRMWRSIVMLDAITLSRATPVKSPT